MKKIVVGSRGSKLAMVQAESVVRKLKQVVPSLEISICKISTVGDRNLQVSLENAEGTGFFVKELEEALLEGRVDLAVHSLKDVPSELPEGLALTAVPERADPRDVLVSKGRRLADLARGAKIGTGSLRRSLQLTALRPDVKPTSIRGNVDTRVAKVDSGEYDALVTASAALVRLDLEGRIVERFDTSSFLPAVGQGALAIESRRDDVETNAIISTINDVVAWQSVSAERAFLFALGGGCQAPIAALALVDNGRLRIDGLVASAKQRRVLRDRETGDANEAIEVGRSLAKRLLDQGGGKFIEEAKLR